MLTVRDIRGSQTLPRCEPLAEALHALYGPTIAIRATIADNCVSQRDIPHGNSGSEGLGGIPTKHFFLLNDHARKWLGTARCDEAVLASCMKAVSQYSFNHGYWLQSGSAALLDPKRFPVLFVWPCHGRPTHPEPTMFERWRDGITLPEATSDIPFQWTRKNIFTLTRRQAALCDHEASRRVALQFDSLRALSSTTVFEKFSPEQTRHFFQRMFEVQEMMGERIPAAARVVVPALDEVVGLHRDRAAYMARFESFEKMHYARLLYSESFYEAAARVLFSKLCARALRSEAKR